MNSDAVAHRMQSIRGNHWLYNILPFQLLKSQTWKDPDNKRYWNHTYIRRYSLYWLYLKTRNF